MTTSTPRPLPTWALWVGSVVIGLHLVVFGALALAAPSGPWPTPAPFPPEPGPALAPSFAAAINDLTGPLLRPLYLSHNYHFATNEPDLPGVEFEVRLKTKQGQVKVLKFPDKDANRWVRHRHQMLALGLAGDMPVQRAQGQLVLPQGKKFETFQVWERTNPEDPNDPKNARLVKVNELELTGDPATDPKHRLHRISNRPADWALIAANAYVRYLCRVHDAESGELVRRHRYAIHPTMLFVPSNLPLPEWIFQDHFYTFGEVRLQEDRP